MEKFDMWEKNIDINEVKEIRSKTTVFFGVGAITKIKDIAAELSKKGISKILVVTGRSSYKKAGAWDHVKKALEENNIQFVLCDKAIPNPTIHQVDEAAKMGIDFGAQAVLAIGGGSPIDTGKSAAILLKYPEKTGRDIYEYTFTPEEAAPIVTINLTHGTGTEADRVAVVSIPDKNFKPAIAYDCIYPMYSIDDPALMVSLSKEQTIYTSVDAVNHVLEAATSKINSPYSIMMAKETIRLVGKYLPMAVENPEDLTARYYLAYAAMIAGISFDNALLHFTHALEHPLSAVKPDFTHGLGLGILLPAVIKQIYPAAGNIVADIFSSVIPGLTGCADEAEKAAIEVEKWLVGVGVTSKLEDEGFAEGDIAKLVELTKTTPSLDLLLSLAPTEATDDAIEAIFKNSLKPMAA
jgi:alcohol dehydrogenase class IV